MNNRLLKLLSAIGVAVVAFFELCFTAKAKNAWKLAKKRESN